jgi:hypothetical protein
VRRIVNMTALTVTEANAVDRDAELSPTP